MSDRPPIPPPMNPPGDADGLPDPEDAATASEASADQLTAEHDAVTEAAAAVQAASAGAPSESDAEPEPDPAEPEPDPGEPEPAVPQPTAEPVADARASTPPSWSDPVTAPGYVAGPDAAAQSGRPELLVGAAFVGGLALAFLMRRLANR